jgi:hypothetical protein
MHVFIISFVFNIKHGCRIELGLTGILTCYYPTVAGNGEGNKVTKTTLEEAGIL